MAAAAVDRMFDLLPPQDVGDPQSFLAAMIALFAKYPVGVYEAAVFDIPQRSDQPRLKLVRAVLDEIYAPIERQLERERIKPLALPAPPRHRPTAEEIAAKLGRVPAPRQSPAVKGEPTRNDGNHAARVKADLEARRARRERGQDAVKAGS